MEKLRLLLRRCLQQPWPVFEILPPLTTECTLCQPAPGRPDMWCGLCSHQSNPALKLGPEQNTTCSQKESIVSIDSDAPLLVMSRTANSGPKLSSIRDLPTGPAYGVLINVNGKRNSWPRESRLSCALSAATFEVLCLADKEVRFFLPHSRKPRMIVLIAWPSQATLWRRYICGTMM